jgi:hypothetical protein
MQVWPMTVEKWEKQLARKSEDGSIKLIELDNLLNAHFDGSYSRMEKELIYVNNYFKINQLEQRNKQIQLYNRFKSCYSSALEIENIRTKLEFSSRFDELSDLLNIESEQYKEWNLNKMDGKLEKTIRILDKMNEDKLDCLKAFSESLKLINWLKANANSLTELKFLVDLTSSSTSTSMDRSVLAKTLKEAGTAFASLIYELNTEDGFYVFMELCEKCFSHLDSDRFIAAKLRAIKDQVKMSLI